MEHAAPPAPSFTAPLAARQQRHATSRLHIWKHTRAQRIMLICGKTQQQQTMGVLFRGGLDVPDCFKDFLRLAAVGVSKSVYAVSFFFFLETL